MIKRYAERRLYHPTALTYITFEDLTEMIDRREPFEVVDSETGADVTSKVLTQIISERAGS